MYGLDDKYIDFIISVLKKNIDEQDAKFYIFGSRTKGTYKEYSDIDIAIELADRKLPVDILGKILLEFSDSTLPYEVDVVDLNSIDKDFKDMIQDSLVLLNS